MTPRNLIADWRGRDRLLVTRESRTLDAVLRIGQGLRMRRDYVLPEPDPDAARDLIPDRTDAPSVCIRCVMHRDEPVDSARMKAIHAATTSRTAFEAVRIGEIIAIQHVVCEAAESETVGHLLMSFPQSVFRHGAEDALTLAADAALSLQTAEFRLADYPARPLETDIRIPPLARVAAFFESPWSEGAGGILILYERCRRSDWNALYRHLALWAREPGTGVLMPLLPEPDEIKKKMTPEMYAVVVRIFGENDATLEGLARNFIAACATTRQGLVWSRRIVGLDELLGRRSRSEGLLLNADELAALAAFPSPDVRSSILERARLPHLRAQRDFTRRHDP